MDFSFIRITLMLIKVGSKERLKMNLNIPRLIALYNDKFSFTDDVRHKVLRIRSEQFLEFPGALSFAYVVHLPRQLLLGDLHYVVYEHSLRENVPYLARR